MENDIFRCLEEGIDNIQSIISDVATIYRNCTIPSIIPEFFQALGSLLSDDYIFLEWGEYKYSEDEIQLLNHLEVEQQTGYWKWHVAVMKNEQVQMITLQGIGNDSSSIKDVKKSLHSFGLNTLLIRDDVLAWDNQSHSGLSPPTITLKEKGIDVILNMRECG